MKNPLTNTINKQMNDSLLLEKTGKSLEEWFQFMDRFISLGLSEKELSRLIRENFRMNSMWHNAIISTYINQKKNKPVNEFAEEFKIVKAIELQLPLTTLYNLWSDFKLRNTWFPLVSYTIVRENPKKLVQLLWSDSVSIVNIRFSKIDKSKSQVQIIHSKLTNKKTSEDMEVYWKRVLEALHESVSSVLFHSLILDI
jgi:hypothetical protein